MAPTMPGKHVEPPIMAPVAQLPDIVI